MKVIFKLVNFRNKSSGTKSCLDRSDVNPEASVIRLVLGVRVNLALDPLNRLPVKLDIWSVRMV